MLLRRNRDKTSHELDNSPPDPIFLTNGPVNMITNGMTGEPMTKSRKKAQVLIILSLLFACTFQSQAEDVPHEIAGIALGTSIEDYAGIIPYNYLREVVVTDWHGFRKGMISYGTCRYIKKILKIDMKYEDKSYAFYKKLLAAFRKKFGNPDAWTGDSFGVMHVWKWQFIDKEQNRVSLSLQYNGKNSNETIGNVVKLSYPEKMEEERLCFMEMCENNKNNVDPKRIEELKKFDWSHLVPQ